MLSTTDPRKCYDPYNVHEKCQRKTLRVITADYSKKIDKVPNIKKSAPGNAICSSCRVKIGSSTCQEDENNNNNSSTDQETPSSSEGQNSQGLADVEAEIAREKTLEEVNTLFHHLGLSPIKLHAVASHSRPTYCKRKLETAFYSLEKKLRLATGHDQGSSDNKLLPLDIESKSIDMDFLISLIKTKLNCPMNYRQRIQLLTLIPSSWSQQRIMNEFNVSKYAVQQSRKLLNEQGILAMPAPYKGDSLDPNTVDLVVQFYLSGENTRMMPGRNDKVSVSKNKYEQKRLLLLNLDDLYGTFKEKYPNVEIGFSKFCMLRPKQCILAGAPGTHAVCVCATHQNVVLMLHATSMKKSYHELIEYLVCSPKNRDCMLRHCPNCPNSENLENFLLAEFDDWDFDDEVSYYSWTQSGGRMQQVEYTVPLSEYISTLIQSLENLIPHSYIAKAQNDFINNKKENLAYDEAVVILDFSENYTYVSQNEVQGNYWSRESCTLHPAVMYTRDRTTNEVIATSFCVLSDDLEHDVPFVYETQKLITQYIQENFPHIKKIWFVSDGCAAQYKNYKNFINLCKYEEDFQIIATWIFFATSHGKTAVDGIGGTVKRTVSKASLQTDLGSPINSVQKVFDFCKLKITGIKFWLLKKEVLAETRKQLEVRFLEASTVPGTRSFHHFVPLSTTSIGAKRISNDENFALTFHFSPNQRDLAKKIMSEISTNTYVACTYDEHWFFGRVLSKSEEENDLEVSFMHPYGPSPSFYWPQSEDVCHVPVISIIASVNTPSTSSGRVYHFCAKDIKLVEQKFASLIS